MLIHASPEAIDALECAAACLKAVTPGSLVEITRQNDRLVIAEIVGPGGHIPDNAGEAFIAAFHLGTRGDEALREMADLGA